MSNNRLAQELLKQTLMSSFYRLRPRGTLELRVELRFLLSNVVLHVTGIQKISGAQKKKQD